MASSIAKPPVTTVLCVGMGNIGSEVINQLKLRKDVQVITASRSRGDLQFDLSSLESVMSLDKMLPPSSVDHIVVTAGASKFGSLANFKKLETWEANINGKLLAVTKFVLLLIHSLKILKDGGSITITTGMAARTINKLWPGIAVNNAGLDAFVLNGGIDLPRSLRLNAVAPALVTETAKKAGLPVKGTVPAATVAAAYLPHIFGDASARVSCVGTQVKFEKTHDKDHDAST